jgi:NAD(P)H dehydrogenase (quinone)
MMLITGATGAVGGSVARLLEDEGQQLRLLVRDRTRAPDLPNAEVVTGDYADPASLDRAFAGIHTAFVVSGYAEPMVRARQHRNAFAAATRAGVGHVVYLSFQGAAPNSRFPMSRDHHQSERYLRESGVPYTALRDNLYLDLVPEMFGQDGVVRGPAGQGATAFVAREDAARVAAAVLASPPEVSGTCDVTGPEALTLAETAARLSALVGRELHYQEESVEAGRAWRGELGAPDWEVATWLGSYEAIAAGELRAVSDTVERFTGRPARNLEAYFGEYPHLLDKLRAGSEASKS